MENKLFNPVEFRSLSEKFDLTDEKKELLTEYVGKLKNNYYSDAERKHYLDFYDIILKGILEYKRGKHIRFDEKEEEGRGFSEFVLKYGQENDDKKFMVVELKKQGTNLDKPQLNRSDKRSPVDQAFGYAIHSGDIEWILLSNFEEIRLYNYHEKMKYISFDAKKLLNIEEFRYFMLAFSKKSFIDLNLIDKLIESTSVIERKIENDFYNLYNDTRLMLVKELEEYNGFNRTESVNYAQLILNRYMFISFAEDTGLLPSQISTKSISKPIQNKDLRDNVIWNRLNDLFNDIKKGRKDDPYSEDIYAYNGGLFNEDLGEIKLKDIIKDMDSFKKENPYWNSDESDKDISHLISNYANELNPIFINLLKISAYDFSTELDVNILGHIFENSIGDLENLKEGIDDLRKRDGIFYTPQPITNYICKNTIIPYLSKSGKVNTVHELIKEYSWGSDIDLLDDKVRKIRIIDPACGSGAFLNRAVDILLDIHRAIYDFKAWGFTSTTEVRGPVGRRRKKKVKHLDLSGFTFEDIDKRREILINNIYGVDINSESVGITKLSLFLNMLKNGKIRKVLPDIDKNIRCGNTLVDCKDPDGFVWKKDYYNILDEGGFDIVIGNPPYIGEKGNKDKFREVKVTEWGKKFYKRKMDYFYFFYHKALDIVRENGFVSFITTNYFVTADGAINLRKDFHHRAIFKKIINFNELKIFEDAKGQHNLIAVLNKGFDEDSSVETCITKRKGFANSKILNDIESGRDSKTKYYELIQKDIYEGEELYIRLEGTGNNDDDTIFSILNKIKSQGVPLSENFNANQGILTGAHKVTMNHIKKGLIPAEYKNNGIYVLSEEELAPLKLPNKEKDIIKPWFKNSDIQHYFAPTEPHQFLIYATRDLNIEDYPHVFKHLKKFKDIINNRSRDRGEMQAALKLGKWWVIFAAREKQIFENEKVVCSYRSPKNNFAYNCTDWYAGSDVFFITKKNEEIDLKYILSLLSSKLYYHWFYYKGKKKGETLEFSEKILKNTPIKPIPHSKQVIFIKNVNEIMAYSERMYKEIGAFKGYLLDQYFVDKLPTNVENYYKLEFKELLDELRGKIRVSDPDVYTDLKEYFYRSVELIEELQNEIDALNTDIDQMVYELYDLTPEEIEIIKQPII